MLINCEESTGIMLNVALLDVYSVGNAYASGLARTAFRQKLFLNIAEETEFWIFDLKGQPLFHQKFDAPSNEINLEK